MRNHFLNEALERGLKMIDNLSRIGIGVISNKHEVA
jgi:hypothetical protein